MKGEIQVKTIETRKGNHIDMFWDETTGELAVNLIQGGEGKGRQLLHGFIDESAMFSGK